MNNGPSIYRWIIYHDLVLNRIGWLGVLFNDFNPFKDCCKIIHDKSDGRDKTIIHLKNA